MRGIMGTDDGREGSCLRFFADAQNDRMGRLQRQDKGTYWNKTWDAQNEDRDASFYATLTTVISDLWNLKRSSK